MSRVEGLYRRFYKSPEVYKREKHLQDCSDIVEDTYKELEASFKRGETCTIVYMYGIEEPARECVLARLKRDAITAHTEGVILKVCYNKL